MGRAQLFREGRESVQGVRTKDSRRQGTGRGALSPKSRENPSCVCHALEFANNFPISLFI